MLTVARLVLIIAVIAVVCGGCALVRKGKKACVIVLAVCGGLYLLTFLRVAGEQPQPANIPFNVADIAMSI